MLFLRCIKLALVHDMAECIVGDIAPSDNISKAEKHRREEVREQHSHYTRLLRSVDMLNSTVPALLLVFFLAILCLLVHIFIKLLIKS